MPRLLVAGLIALVGVSAPSFAFADVPEVGDIEAVAQAYDLACDEPDDVGGGAVHLSCAREIDSGESNIDLSLTYNAMGQDDLATTATAATYGTPPPDWLDMATDVALLFCEAEPLEIRQAVETVRPEAGFGGCTVRVNTDGFVTTVDASPAVASTPPPGPTTMPELPADLDSYVTSYGLACVDRDADRECVMALADGATYSVVTNRDASDAVVEIIAEVRSTDASFPSDGIGFLRGIAERAPVDDPDALLAWLDAAIAGGRSADRHVAGAWTVSWTDAELDPGRTVSLDLRRAGDAAPTAAPAPSEAPPPAESDGARRFAESVPTIAEVSADPVVLLQSGLLAALVVFLMPFPAQLFNSTLETHEDEVKRWFRLDRLGAVAGGIGAFWASWPGVAAFTMLTALLYGFLDPAFGLDFGSVATFVGMLAGIVLVTGAFAIPVVLAHRRIGDAPTLNVVPISLLIGVACVLLSRLTDFQPGYLYGLLIGLVFARELSAAEEGSATAAGAALMLIVALASWLGLGLLPDGDGFATVAARTSLASLMVAGLEGVVFGLLPMRFLPGAPLYAWNRVLWGALLAIGAFAFFHILINPASGYLSDTSRTPLLTVVGLLVGFSLVSVAFWAWFRYRPAPLGPESGADA